MAGGEGLKIVPVAAFNTVFLKYTDNFFYCPKTVLVINIFV